MIDRAEKPVYTIVTALKIDSHFHCLRL